MKARTILAAACLLLAWQAGPAHADSGAVPSPQESAVLGNDVSWPQCGGQLPAPPAFAVVGVNGGRPTTANPCLAEQLAWADGSSEAAAGVPSAIYVNTAATGAVGSLWWPANNSVMGTDIGNPYGMCDGTASPACAYVHGYVMAYNDAGSLAGAGGGAAHRMWWLDVETGNSWLSNKAANTAELEGMTAYLQGAGVEVGIYSTGYQFGEIVGEVGPHSNLYSLKSWLAGAESTSSAADLCGAAPLASGGVVALTQFTAGNLDYNFRCPVAQPVAPPPALAPPAAPEPAPTPARTRSNRYADIPAAQIA